MTTINPKRISFVLGILSLVAAAGLPVLFVLIRMKVFTFRDDFYGFNAAGFAFTWALVLLLTGALLGGLACLADGRSWLARFALGINGVLTAGLLTAGLLWGLLTLGWSP